MEFLLSLPVLILIVVVVLVSNPLSLYRSRKFMWSND